MAMLRYLTDQNWPGDIYFIYCAKTPPDIIFRSELDDLQARFRNLHLVVALTRADATDWSGVKGRLSRDLLIQTIPNLSAQTFYLCGPGSMMEPTIQLLRELGVPAEKIRTEAFGAAKKTEAQLIPAVAGDTALPATPGSLGATSPAANGNRPTLTFSRSAKTTPLVPDQTLLEIAEAAGLSPDFECRSGICGRCKTRLLAGCVTMDVQDALDDRDRSGNIILLCQAKASANVTIEV
jgi:ferredoxin-NADP reductase